MRQFIDLAFSRRLEIAMAHAGRSAAQAAAARSSNIPFAIAEVAGGLAIFAGPSSPATQVVGVGLNGPVSGASLDEIEQFFSSRGAPVIMKLSPFIHCSLMKALGDRPYRLQEFSNVLHVEVNAPPDRMLSPGISVREASREDEPLFSRLVANGYGGQITVQSARINNMEGLFERDDAHCFIASVNGNPAGAGGLWEHGGICCFWGASTLPEFRRRGVQSALIAARMAWAAKNLCTSAIVIAKPGSDAQRIMERFGFHSIYSRTTLVRH